MRHLLLVLLCLPAVAFAAAKPAFKKTDFAPDDFLQQYMHCEELKPNYENSESLDCRSKVNVHFCKIYDPLPQEVKNNISLELYCNFLANDVNAPTAQKEADTLAILRDSGCLSGDTKRASLNQKYSHGSDEQDALENFTHAYLSNEARCEE